MSPHLALTVPQLFRWCKYCLRWQSHAIELFYWQFINPATGSLKQSTSSWSWQEAMSSIMVESQEWRITSAALGIRCQHMYVCSLSLTVLLAECITMTSMEGLQTNTYQCQSIAFKVGLCISLVVLVVLCKYSYLCHVKKLRAIRARISTQKYWCSTGFRQLLLHLKLLDVTYFVKMMLIVSHLWVPG